MVKNKRNKAKPNFYAVAKGRQPGIYTTWTEWEKQTKRYSRAVFQGFITRQEAEQFLLEKGKKQVATDQNSHLIKVGPQDDQISAKLNLERDLEDNSSTVKDFENKTDFKNACSQHIKLKYLKQAQREGAEIALSGQNIFLTGSAGTGKSYLLQYLIQQLRNKYKRNNHVVITASTGIAARNIGGVTLHSFGGIGYGRGDIISMLWDVQNNKSAVKRWKACEVLFVDEISMLDDQIFDILEQFARILRNDQRPFGGIQLILCGDFFQLPPVSLGRNLSKFVFKSLAWMSCNIQTIELTEVVRQAGDSYFIDILNQIRYGLFTEECAQLFASCRIDLKPIPNDGILPTKIYCKNDLVDVENFDELAKLQGDSISFTCVDKYVPFRSIYNIEMVKQDLQSRMDKSVAQVLQLKIGAQVMFTKNDPENRLVNGSRGIVEAFDENTFPTVKFDNGVTLAITRSSFFQEVESCGIVREQLPLKLAWALTVHKSQGMTLTRAILKLDNAFDFGQAYVALSRVASIAGIWITGRQITQSAVKAHPEVKEFYQRGIRDTVFDN